MKFDRYPLEIEFMRVDDVELLELLLRKSSALVLGMHTLSIMDSLS